jgi:ribosomal protein L40E
MTCQNCDAENDVASNFCTKCGSSLLIVPEHSRRNEAQKMRNYLSVYFIFIIVYKLYGFVTDTFIWPTTTRSYRHNSIKLSIGSYERHIVNNADTLIVIYFIDNTTDKRLRAIFSVYLALHVVYYVTQSFHYHFSW